MICPTPEKVAYSDRAAAVTAATVIRCDRRGPALEPYRCYECGAWHLASQRSLTARIHDALGGGRRG